MRPTMTRGTGLLLLAMLAAGLSSQAGTAYGPYFPLLDDWSWSFADGGSSLTAEVTGEREVLGQTVIVVTTTRDAEPSYETYFSVDVDGNVFLHGFDNPGIPATRAYDPPIRYMPYAPVAESVWATSHTRYGDLDGADSLGVFTTRYEVIDEVSLTVPAGTFDCILVEGGRVKGGDRFAVDGRSLRVGDDGLDWYARDVGRVRRIGPGTYDLVSFAGTVVPVRAVSWSRLKRWPGPAVGP